MPPTPLPSRIYILKMNDSLLGMGRDPPTGAVGLHLIGNRTAQSASIDLHFIILYELQSCFNRARIYTFLYYCNVF